MAKRRVAGSKELKDDVIRVRVTREQKAALVERAARDGLELSAWTRQHVFRAAGLLPEAEDAGKGPPPRGGHK